MGLLFFLLEILAEMFTELCAELCGELLLAVLIYGMGWLAISVFSLGLLTPAPAEHLNDAQFREARGIRWWHLTYRDGDETFVPAEVVVLAGFVCLGVFGLTVYGIAVWITSCIS